MTLSTHPLLDRFQGDFLDDPISREVYSRDSSIFRIRPLAIAHPKELDDLFILIDLAKQEGLSLIPRGGATATTGASLGAGISIDFSKYRRRILEFHGEAELLTVESGAILEEINQFLAPRNLRFGPETSTANRATIAGMVACNASGARSLRFGSTMDNIYSIDTITLEKESLLFKQYSTDEEKALIAKSPLFSRLLPWIETVRTTDREEIMSGYLKGSRHSSGYPLDQLLSTQPLNLAKLLVGSEGTLALFDKVTLKCLPQLKNLGMVVIHFDTMEEALASVEGIGHWNPLSFELIDRHILQLARLSPKIRGEISWLKGSPEALVIAEFEADSLKELKLRLSNFESDLRRQHIGYALFQTTEPASMNAIWTVRKEGLGLLMSKRSYTNAIAFLEDLAVSPEDVPAFCRALIPLFQEHQKEFGLYGHLGAGCLHLRPYLNLKEESDLTLINELFEKISNLVLQFHGALSGEHGDGIIRSALNKKLFGEKIYARFFELKKIFDPENRLNPGKIVNAPSFKEARKYLRLSPETTTLPFTPFFDYTKTGGFVLGIDLCNGNGLCRKNEGLMCPSFQATLDERESTRGRANLLFGLIHGHFNKESITTTEALDVLDLCLECKGCKKECPSSVDMAKLKMEMLFQAQKTGGLSLRDRLLSDFPKMAAWGSYFPKIVNGLMDSPLGTAFKKWVGLSSTHALPKLARKPFQSKIADKTNCPHGEVLLLIDTYTKYCVPEIGYAAEKVLFTMGFYPKALYLGCCGRPLFSKGRLNEGKQQALNYLKKITPHLQGVKAIISLEPSCHSLMKDEYRDLQEPRLLELSERVISFDQFIAKELDLLLPHLRESTEKILFHRHCHDKALQPANATMDILKRISGSRASEIPSGCCGMAGSFGYEAEHGDLSEKIANLVLLPKIEEEPEATLIINGFSCRTQVAELAKRRGQHLAEHLALLLRT